MWVRTGERTAASVSAIIDLDLSFSRLSWAERAISDERRRRFSTLSAEMCALSSSIFTLRVEFNLGEDSDQTAGGPERAGRILCDMLVGEQEPFLDWTAVSRVLRPAVSQAYSSRTRGERRSAEC